MSYLIWWVWAIGRNSLPRLVTVARSWFAAGVGRILIVVSSIWLVVEARSRGSVIVSRRWGCGIIDWLVGCIDGSGSVVVSLFLFIIRRLEDWTGIPGGEVGRSSGGIIFCKSIVELWGCGGVVSWTLFVVRSFVGVIFRWFLVGWRSTWSSFRVIGWNIGIVVGRKFFIGTGSRFQVVWAIVIAGDIVARCSLMRSLCGEGSKSICVASRSGIVTMLFVLVAISGRSCRRIIRIRCEMLALVMVVGFGSIRRCSIVVRSNCCVSVIGRILVVMTNCGIIARTGVSCWRIISNRFCVMGFGFSFVARRGVIRSRVLSSCRRVVSWSLSFVASSGISRRIIVSSRCRVVRRSRRGEIRIRFVSSRFVLL